jgi:hypothetical protein
VFSCALDDISMGQQLSFQERFFDGSVFNEVNVFEEFFKVIRSGEAGGHVNSVLESSLQQVPDASLLHIPAHKNIHVHPEDNVDQHGQ